MGIVKLSCTCIFVLQMTISCKPSFREAGPRSYREVRLIALIT